VFTCGFLLFVSQCLHCQLQVVCQCPSRRLEDNASGRWPRGPVVPRRPGRRCLLAHLRNLHAASPSRPHAVLAPPSGASDGFGLCVRYQALRVWGVLRLIFLCWRSSPTLARMTALSVPLSLADRRAGQSSHSSRRAQPARSVRGLSQVSPSGLVRELGLGAHSDTGSSRVEPFSTPMRVLCVEALERTHTGVLVPPGTSKHALEFLQSVRDAFVAAGVDDAV
jgi:hypothetical protein